MKRFTIQNNIGKAKYVISHHDGLKRHEDGSDFFDISIFSNKKALSCFIARLKGLGYVEL